MSTITVDDDAVLAWWEDYDAGAAVQTIARRAGVTQSVVTRELEALGVFEDPIIRRAKAGELRPDELAIMDALAKVGGPEDLSPERREIPWAHSLQHTSPKRGPVVQSARQRRQDRVSGKWRAIVRADLRAAGLLP